MRLVHSHPWPVKQSRFHGRVEADDRECEAVGCEEPGEFRAPGDRGAGFDGPGQWRWFCLDHVRLFNSSYNWFAGMSADEIVAAQHPAAGWANSSTTRAFRADAGVDGTPRWADFDDPLDAIGARANDVRQRARREATASRFTRDERAALDTLAFMPLASADPFGGVIITDWYQPPTGPGERFKATGYILGRQLRADGVRVAVYRQVLQGGQWADAPVSPATTGEIENKVLARARELRSQTASR